MIGSGRLGVALTGVLSGLLTAIVARSLPPAAAPLGMLIVLTVTLIVGRVAPFGPALAHGVCAWATIHLYFRAAHSLPCIWSGLPSPWLSLVLVEDMVLLGRLGRARHHAKSRRMRC